MRSVAATLCAIAIALVSATAQAQGHDAAAADALFREARALMRKGDFETACPKLVDSQKLDPAAGTAINLGDCLQHTGKLADALQSFRDALDLLRSGDPRVAPTKEQVSALERRVPRLAVRLVDGAPEGTRVMRDGIELGAGSLGSALPVNPGEHWVVISAPGRADSRRRVTLVEGKTREVLVDVGDRIPSAPTPSPASPTRGEHRAAPQSHEDAPTSTRRTVAYVVGGVGILGLAAGAGFMIAAGNKSTQAQTLQDRLGPSGCTTSPRPATCDDLQAAQQDHDSDTKLAAASFIVGGAGIATAAVLLLLPDTSQPSTTALRPMLSANATGARVGLAGFF